MEIILVPISTDMVFFLLKKLFAINIISCKERKIMYQLPKLPYDYQKLEPYIDTHTITLHYHKHTQNYLNKLNNLLIKNNYDFNIPMIELARNGDYILKNDKEDIYFNLGGALNHEIYFNSMSEYPKLPNEKLMKNIEKTYGNFQNFKNKFKETALMLKGSGYTFLVVDSNNKLQIINLPNQETPYYYNLIPLIGLDLWEHAYYLNYENKKDLYIDNFFEVMDFTVANKLYERITD